MGEILGIGLSHYPPLCGLDEDMAAVLRATMTDRDISARSSRAEELANLNAGGMGTRRRESCCR